jgi:drug/metabolite transporter (DMT)-like permease
MFESLEPRPELAKDWIIAAYLSNFVIGTSGVLIAFWKYGTSHPLVLVCWTAMSLLALYFFVAARITRPTSKAVSIRCSVLLFLILIPSMAHMLLMK